VLGTANKLVIHSMNNIMMVRISQIIKIMTLKPK
jgi:hypothetical protein